jgi:hypothetical protein
MNMKKLLTFLFALMLMSAYTFGNGNYFSWTGAADGVSWNNAGNWTAPAQIPYYPEPVGTSTWPGQNETGDFAAFVAIPFATVYLPQSITLGGLEITYTSGSSASVIFLMGGSYVGGNYTPFDGYTITMSVPSATHRPGLLWSVKDDEGCYLDMNTSGARVKLVMQHGANFWYKNGSTFNPAQYTDCDGQKGFYLEAVANDHAEFIQQEYQYAPSASVRGWIQYIFDDSKYHYFAAPITSVWPAISDPQFSQNFCRKHNTLCVFDGDYARKFANGGTWTAWLGLCAPIVPNPIINFEMGRGYEYYGNPTNNPSGSYDIYGDFNTPPVPPQDIDPLNPYTGPGYVVLPVTTAGWNFIGNPFPSAIKFDEPSGAPTAGVGWTWDLNKTAPSVYFWDNNLGIYRVYNWFTGVGNGGFDLAFRRTIPRSQGFFVYVTNYSPKPAGYEWQSNTSDITLGNLARIFRPEIQINKSGVANSMNLGLADATNNTIDEAIIAFREDASGTNYNDILDARKLYNDNASAQLYFKTTDQTDACIKSLKLESGNIMYPLYLKVLNTGTYSINAKELTFSSNTGIMLKDNKTNTTVDLTVNPVYSFTATAGDDDARFSLYFSNVLYGINNLNNNSFNIYSYNNSIFIQNNDIATSNGSITVYDMIGKQMIQENLSGNAITRINTNLNTGFYIVSVKTDKGVSVQKVYIN